jgi:hypothetical protein
MCYVSAHICPVLIQVFALRHVYKNYGHLIHCINMPIGGGGGGKKRQTESSKY